MIKLPKPRKPVLPDLGKPIDDMTAEERLVYVEKCLKRVAAAAQRARHGYFAPSKRTKAICGTGRGWYPPPELLR